MAAKRDYIHQRYDGGQNDTASADQLAENQGKLVQNGYLRTPGKFIKRSGCTLVGDDTGSTAITGHTTWTNPSGTSYQLRTTGTKLQYLNASAWADMDTGFTSGLPTEFVPANGKLYILNGTDTTHVWDGTSVTLNSCLTELNNTTVPTAKYGIWWKNYLILWGTAKYNGSTYNGRAFFSNLGAPETFTTATDFFDVGYKDGTDGTAIFGMDKYIILGKDKSMFLMTGVNPTEWILSATVNNVSSLDASIGVASHRSFVQVGNDAWFMGSDGQMRSVNRTSFGSSPLMGIVSGNVRGTLAAMNKGQLGKVASVLFDGRVYVAFPDGTSTYNNKVLVADTSISLQDSLNPHPWVTYTGWSPSCWYIRSSSGTQQLCFGEASADSKSYQAETGTSDNSVAIDFDYISGFMTLKNPEKSKNFKFVIVEGDSGGNYNVTWTQSLNGTDFLPVGVLNLSSGEVWDTATFDHSMWGYSTTIQKKFNLQTNSSKVMVRARNNAAGEPVTINTYTVVLKARKTR